MSDQVEKSEEALQQALAVVGRIKFRLHNLTEKHDSDKLQLRYNNLHVFEKLLQF
jgi:hypothetical protein